MPFLRTRSAGVRACSSCSTYGRVSAVPYSRLRGYSVVASSRSEEVTVNRRSNGSITLNVHHPLAGSNASTIILYLPPGPIPRRYAAEADAQIISALSAASNATIVRINYRFSPVHRFPTPVHDVLAGYDWVVKHLVPSFAWRSRHGRRSNTMAQLGVCGELAGGGLATMLALTECRMGESRIAAAAVNNPLVDWVLPEPALRGSSAHENDVPWMDDLPLNEWVDASLFPSSQKPKAKMKRKATHPSWTRHAQHPVLSASSLRYARNELFRKPANYFDPFASPILFFRTAGADVPPDEPLDDFASLVEDGPTMPVPTARRVSHRLYPPTGSALRLPDMRISFGEESVLHDQGVELVKLMRRSVLRDLELGQNSREGSAGYLADLDDNGDGAERAERHSGATTEVARRISSVENAGVGLWGLPGDCMWRRRVEEVGSWFRKRLA